MGVITVKLNKKRAGETSQFFRISVAQPFRGGWCDCGVRWRNEAPVSELYTLPLLCLSSGFHPTPKQGLGQPGQAASPSWAAGLAVGRPEGVQEGNVGHEGGHHLRHIQLWDLIGLELFHNSVQLHQVLLKKTTRRD